MAGKLQPLNIGDLRVEVPIIQGGMAVKVSTSSLAAAVAECGGAGTIASAGLGFGTAENETDFVKASREGLQREIRNAKAATRGVVGVNILVALSNYEDLARTAAKEGAHFIASGAGLPLKLPEYVEGSDTRILPIISSARAAALMTSTWKKRYDRLPDGIIVEGPLAGGHLGFKADELRARTSQPLEAIVPEVLGITRGLNIPVIAAGGIFDGKDIAKFLKLGAAGVQIASRFVVTAECSVSQKFKDLFLAAQDKDVMIIDSPVGMPGRAIKTPLIERLARGERVRFKCGYRCLRSCNPAASPYCIAKALDNASRGLLEEAVVFCGHNVSRIDKMTTVRELFDELVSGALAEMALAGRPGAGPLRS
ncbi:MAG: nitronate monooxygenase family protein [Elusimicrobiota bacterium]